jgi:LemA protein
MEALVALLILLAVFSIPLLWVVAVYNRLTSVRLHIRESWSDIDVELKRRYDLIPNLVETVKGYAAHEREVLQRIVELRNRAMAPHTGPAELAVDESELLRGLRQLMAVVEAYPELKADSQYLALQQELALTEDRIAAARRFYNGNVREMNQLCQSFPTNLIASAFDFHTAEYFELANSAEREAPRVTTR